jgi:hypothetical protein
VRSPSTERFAHIYMQYTVYIKTYIFIYHGIYDIYRWSCFLVVGILIGSYICSTVGDPVRSPSTERFLALLYY